MGEPENLLTIQHAVNLWRNIYFLMLMSRKKCVFRHARVRERAPARGIAVIARGSGCPEEERYLFEVSIELMREQPVLRLSEVRVSLHQFERVRTRLIEE